MNLDTMIAEAYGHFLHACSYELYKKIVFAHFAKDELDLPEEEIPNFMRSTEDRRRGRNRQPGIRSILYLVLH